MKKQIILYADENKWLTDGEHYGKIVRLAEGLTAEGYSEITDEEYREAMAKREAEEGL